MKNRYEKRDGYVVIFANGGGRIHEILIDEEDLDLVASFPGTWRAHRGGSTYYAEIVAGFTDGKQKIIRMHRVILNPPTGLDVDHKNHNGLDNCRVNIRVATRGENARNARNNVQFQSDVDGVTWNVRNKTWQVQVKANDRWEYLASIRDRIIAEAAAFMYRETGKRVRWSNPREIRRQYVGMPGTGHGRCIRG